MWSECRVEWWGVLQRGGSGSGHEATGKCPALIWVRQESLEGSAPGSNREGLTVVTEILWLLCREQIAQGKDRCRKTRQEATTKAWWQTVVTQPRVAPGHMVGNGRILDSL